MWILGIGGHRNRYAEAKHRKPVTSCEAGHLTSIRGVFCLHMFRVMKKKRKNTTHPSSFELRNQPFAVAVKSELFLVKNKEKTIAEIFFFC